MDSSRNSGTFLLEFKIKTSGQASCKTSSAAWRGKEKGKSHVISAATEVMDVTDEQPNG